jgi:DNA-binding CsgD family transcriptional regulator
MGQTERRAPHDPVRLALVALANPKKSAVLVVGPPGSGKSRVLDELRSQPDAVRHPRLLALDDLDQLGPVELARLAEHLDRREARLVGSVRTAAAAAVLRDLRPLRPLAVLELQPWQREEVAAFVAEQTGGALHELTLHRLRRLSGGNPLCLTELVDTGLASGRLRREHDCWTWTGPLLVPPVTTARIADGLARLPATVRDVHATAALAGAVELTVLEAIFGAAPVEAAEEAGVLRIEQHGRRMRVRPAAPVEASVAVQTLPATRRRRLSGALAVELQRCGGRRAEDPVRIARLLWDATVEIPPELRARAAQGAYRQHDTAFAAALLDGAPPVADRGALGEAAELALSGRLDTAAVAVAAAAAADPARAAQLRALVGLVELARGRVAEADRYATELRETGLAEDWPSAYGLGALLGGRVALATGAVRRAVRLLSEGLASDPDSTTPGSAAPGASVPDASVPDASVPDASVPDASVPGDAVPGGAVPGAAVPDGAVLRPYGLTLLALAYTLAGETDVADRVLLDADRATAPVPAALRELAELARAEILLARGRHSGALRTATAVADRCRDDAALLAAALQLCARIQPSAEVADRLAAAAGARDRDPLTAVRVRHARAAAAGDGAALAEVAAAYERCGLHWLAAETAAASLACAEPEHRAPWASADRSLLERVDARADVDLPELWWRGGDRFAPLTQREREITELAAGGWSSPRIAGHLQLSRRTIENHLQHSYRKLGITRREELAAVLGRRK